MRSAQKSLRQKRKSRLGIFCAYAVNSRIRDSSPGCPWSAGAPGPTSSMIQDVGFLMSAGSLIFEHF